MITQDVLEEFFDRTRGLRARGRTSIDIDDECRWSYFFVDEDEGKLLALGELLAEAGFEVRGLLHPGPEDDDQATIFLRVDRVETHTVESLRRRSNEFHALALERGIGNYDGMDVGPPDGL